jgi:hypothetical protein|tara:strand:+ start:521 stop:685 length:165 start_codon:yes stop_codon:yes gene_type:complete
MEATLPIEYVATVTASDHEIVRHHGSWSCPKKIESTVNASASGQRFGNFIALEA